VGAAAELLVGQQREPPLDLIEPGNGRFDAAATIAGSL
jgi:hypothetical protein